MGNVTARFWWCFDRKNIQREVEEELHFHLELLIQEHLIKGMTLEEAKDGASKRFGNVESIKSQCVEISRRSQPFMRALKYFLVLLFIAGFLARIFSADIHSKQVGNMLIVIAALSHLLLNVRILNLPNLNPKNETSLALRLSSDGQMPIAGKDRRGLTPVERVISDE